MLYCQVCESQYRCDQVCKIVFLFLTELYIAMTQVDVYNDMLQHQKGIPIVLCYVVGILS